MSESPESENLSSAVKMKVFFIVSMIGMVFLPLGYMSGREAGYVEGRNDERELHTAIVVPTPAPEPRCEVTNAMLPFIRVRLERYQGLDCQEAFTEALELANK